MNSKRMEDDLKKNEDHQKKIRRRPKQKWKTKQSTKINLIGCDTIVNSPSLRLLKDFGVNKWNIIGCLGPINLCY